MKFVLDPSVLLSSACRCADYQFILLAPYPPFFVLLCDTGFEPWKDASFASWPCVRL